MVHSQPHSEAGKYFRVNLGGGDLPAVYDQSLHGSVIKLIDWADRLESNSTFSQKEIEVGLAFYAHRCLPDLEPGAQFPAAILKQSSELIYGLRVLEYEGHSINELIIVREEELQAADQDELDSQDK